MSEENVDVVRRMFEAYLRDEFEVALSFFADDVAWEDMNGTYRGPAGVAKATARWTGAWEELRMRMDEILDAGKHDVVVVMRQTGRGKGSGVEVESVYEWIYTITDGKISRVRVYTELGEAFKVAGI